MLWRDTYRVEIKLDDSRLWTHLATFATFHEAKAYALCVYDTLPIDAVIHVWGTGRTCWGPFYEGSTVRPMERGGDVSCIW